MTDPTNTTPNAAAPATPASPNNAAAAAPKVKHKPGKTAIERSEWKRARAKELGQIK